MNNPKANQYSIVNNVDDAIDQLQPAKWASTAPSTRLELLRQIRINLYNAIEELATADAKMKNDRLGEELYTADSCKPMTSAAMGFVLTGAIDLYTSINNGNKGFEPGSITKVPGKGNISYYDISVAPLTLQESLFYLTRRDYLRVKKVAATDADADTYTDEPKRIGPMEKKTKIVAVLGAGNYSSPIEVLKAIFYNNCVAVHKAHPLNEECDKIWARILDPLVQAGCLSFCNPDQGPALIDAAAVERSKIDIIYFTGGTATAQTIMKKIQTRTTTPIQMICECGGVNPAILVPGSDDRAWTDREMAHHAQQLVSLAKFNGGHICARPQLLVTCRNWSQRDAFLRHVETAIRDSTFAQGSYYPGTDEIMQRFEEEYQSNTTSSPYCQRIRPEHGKYKTADFLWVTGDEEDGYACRKEAFCQVMVEVPLDTAATASDFLPYATQFCNDKVLGSLCATIIIDGRTQKKHSQALEMAVTELNYGSIGVNLVAANAFQSQYLIWGGNENGKPLESGNGHFGNVFGFENVEKSSMYKTDVAVVEGIVCV